MLSLSVPALEIKPGIPAETRPKKLQELVATLPSNHPDEAARLILEELQHLNRQAVSPESRYKALEIYRRAVLGIAGQLAERYSGQALPLPDTAITSARLAQTLFIELAYGYKHAIIAEQSKIFALGSNKQLAVLIQRTLDTPLQTASGGLPHLWHPRVRHLVRNPPVVPLCAAAIAAGHES